MIKNPKYEEYLSNKIDTLIPLISVDKLSTCTDNYTLLDVRSVGEYRTSSIYGSVRATDQDYDQLVKELPTGRPIVLYCTIGVRSERLGARLATRGYKVYNLQGGIIEWVNQGHPVYRKDDDGDWAEAHPVRMVHVFYPWLKKYVTPIDIDTRWGLGF